MLVAEVDVSSPTVLATDMLELWNVGIINGANWGEEKLNMLETVYGRISLQTAKQDHRWYWVVISTLHNGKQQMGRPCLTEGTLASTRTTLASGILARIPQRQDV